VPEEQQTIAAMHDPDVLHALELLRQEGEGRVHERRGPPHQVDEDATKPFAAAAAATITTVAAPVYAHAADRVPAADLAGPVTVAVEEALQRLGKLPAVEGVGDGVAPGFGDALEAADGLEGDAGEDLHERVVGEPGHRAAPLGTIHLRAWREGSRDPPPGRVGTDGMAAEKAEIWLGLCLSGLNWASKLTPSNNKLFNNFTSVSLSNKKKKPWFSLKEGIKRGSYWY
jgi:hypothetical protein